MLDDLKVKKVDKQGRIVLPAEWRKKSLLKDEVLVITREGEVRIMAKKDKKLSSFYEKAHESDLEVDPFEDYEKSLAEASQRSS